MWFFNGRVFTAAPGNHFVTSFRVVEQRFDAVGRVPDIADGDDEIVDLRGATVLPGLLDVHTHPAFLSTLLDTIACLPPAVGSVADLVDVLRTSPAHGAGPEAWIEGFGFDESGYPEGRQPNRHDLDRVSSTQPVFLRRCDGHSAVANSVALARAGIDRHTPDPPGAAFGRDETGEPDGRLIEVAATDAVARLIPVPDGQQRTARVARLAEHFAERGIVGVGDLLATEVPEPLATFRAAAASCNWFPQTGLYLGWDHIKAGPPTLREEDRAGQVAVAGVKVFMDGAYSNRTAWTHDPYPGTSEHGIRTVSDEDLRGAAGWARRNQVQLAVHAMGDRALDHVIGMFEDEDPWLAHVPSIRLDHATLFSPARIERINRARMRFAVVSHTIFFFAEYGAYEHNLSPAQFGIAYPIRDFYEQVPATALSSDNPATAWTDADNVFVSIKAAVVRRSHTGADIGQPQRITVPQAIELYTSRAAQTMPLRGLGRIADGYEAAFVVLDRDIFSIPHDELDQVRITETWAAGMPVYRSAS